ncbi:hypothetical protein T12_13413 [Trichinella patagoniensis]|uniref:Uncharacterized protein n=1 Tax=Trichinella patagoniensis TaxID=990121 RepID=A0A0V0ZC16_9BILA|nr:hypothetical protein T12_13413 [Trichinella patagoniensis]
MKFFYFLIEDLWVKKAYQCEAVWLASIFYPSQQTARGLWKTFLVTLVKFNADYSATVCSVGLPSVPG